MVKLCEQSYLNQITSNGRKESYIFREESSNKDERSPRTEVVTGYGVKLVYDVPQNKFNETLDVRVCWHSRVYLAEVDFGRSSLCFLIKKC